MKTIKLLFLILLLFVKTILFSQWTNQNIGVVPALWGVFFTDYNTGYAVGSNGTIIKTTNGGQNWSPLNSGVSVLLKDVFFVNSNTGYAVGYDKVIKTIDGGSTWVDKTDITWTYNTVYFVDANTGYVGTGHNIRKTINGGDTWTDLTVGNPGYNWNSIQFVNASTGYACGSNINGDGIIYKTTDGGTNWSPQNIGTVPALTSLSFINAMEGCAIGTPGVFLKTTDGGLNWTYISFSSTPYANFMKVKMLNQNVLYIASAWYLIKSIDGGNSWTIKNPCSPSSKVNIFFNDVNTGYIVGMDTTSSAHGILLKTIDGGNASYPLINTSPASFQFGNISIGQSSASQTLNIANLCEQPLEITSITTPAGFEVYNHYNGTWVTSFNNLTIWNIPQDFNFRFKPTLVQQYQGNIVVSSNDNINPVINIPVSGNGLPGTPTPEIDVNQTAVDFGNIQCGQTSPEQNVIISNIGSATLDISSVSAPNGFAVKKGTSGSWGSNISSFSIAAGSNETIYIHFTPVQNQSYTGNVLINSNDADEAVTAVALSGTGYTSPTTGIFSEYASLPGYYEGNGLWGDYDGDNDLDLLVMGKTNMYETITKLYNNNNGVFTEVTGTPFSQTQGPATWLDSDNDGDLDLLLTGSGWNGSGVTHLYINNNGSFSQSTCTYTQLGLGYTESGDYNNDGYADFIINGEYSNQSYTKLYKSNDFSNCHSEIATFQGARYGTAKLIDYDNDGDLDVFLTGQTFINTSNCDNYAKIYENQNGNFTESFNNFTPLNKGSMLLADFNNNGFFDVLLTGKTNNQYTNSTNLYIYNGLAHTEIYSGLPNYSNDNYHCPQSAATADLDNDGDMDIILTGYTGNNSSDQVIKSEVFLNTFPSIPFHFLLSAIDSLPALSKGHVTFGDFNNDHKIDMVFAGFCPSLSCKIFINSGANTNNPPAPPTNLQVTVAGDSALLTWNPSTDDHTPANALTYNVYIGNNPQGCNIVSPLSDVITGFRRIVNYGNAGKNNFFKIHNLQQGQFYCAVQAVDGSFAGSAFSSEMSFNINSSGIINSDNLSDFPLIFPNPSQGVVTLRIPAYSNIELVNCAGVVQKVIINNNKEEITELVKLSPGLYFLHYIIENKLFTKKLVVL